MLAVARRLDAHLDDEALGSMDMSRPLVSDIQLKSGRRVTMARLEEIIEDEKPNYHTTRGRSYLRYANGMYVVQEEWITAAEGAAIVLGRYAAHGTNLDRAKIDALVPDATVRNYRRKAMKAATDIASARRVEDVERYYIQASVLASGTSAVNHPLFMKSVEEAEKAIRNAYPELSVFSAPKVETIPPKRI
ncbi:MAG: hypothetical protein HYS81_03170 [Candidatus Aenigmatarchaeota archaeon]|nr:MAG: hypothetical protein HYS81_03170 [Candidatus Aenigmarchaeota archaeon]